MALRERILAFLEGCPEGADDDILTAKLGVRRPQVNQECRALAARGLIERRSVAGKIRNLLTGRAPAEASTAVTVPTGTGDGRRPWYWEGNVQAAVVRQLVATGHQVLRSVNTATRERGKDIEAVTPDGTLLWISVKGYPEATAKTAAPLQARHWFAGALFDVIVWHGEDPSARLAVAFPDFTTYRTLVARVAWVLPMSQASVLWVRDRGRVNVQRSDDAAEVSKAGQPNELVRRFHEAMLGVYERVRAACPRYHPTRFRGLVLKRGGLGTAKALLATNQVSDGFTELWEQRRLDLSMEALVLEPHWRTLFTPAELAEAQRRLTEAKSRPQHRAEP